ncbi:hypothetical protein ACL02T_13130 [Pseudonocardia sp. RS010]|uniref:hypothetical protein n=1 Tax=Pseudonocardia sp. RS010 TaxID=3385979 RepID=UPI0039A058D7
MTASIARASVDGRQALRDLVTSYARREPPRSVAVVGNAPVSESAPRAREIDDSDLVVRMTSFATDRPGEHRLGTRTDVVLVHRAVRAGPATFADHSSRLYLLVEPGRLYWEREDRPAWWPGSPISVSNRDFTVPLKELLGLDPAEASWPTTGTLAAYMMSELFPEARTRLYGLSILERPDQSRFEHSWGSAVPVTPEHRLHAESALLRVWHDSGRIEVRR